MRSDDGMGGSWVRDLTRLAILVVIVACGALVLTAALLALLGVHIG